MSVQVDGLDAFLWYAMARLQPQIKSSTRFQARPAVRTRQMSWGQYLRVCNLSPVAWTRIDLFIMAGAAIVGMIPLLLPWMWPATTILAVSTLALWVMSSFVPLSLLVRFEPESISNEFLAVFSKQLGGKNGCDVCHDVFAQALTQGKLKSLLKELLARHDKLGRQASKIIIHEVGRSFFHGTGEDSEYRVAQELLLGLVNDNIGMDEIGAVLKFTIEACPDIYFAADVVESCEPNLYGSLQRIYHCDTERLRNVMLARCQRMLVSNRADIFALARTPGQTVAFLQRWARGFGGGGNEHAKTVQAYTYALLEEKPARARCILEGSLGHNIAGATIDLKRLRTVCDPARINWALGRIESEHASGSQKDAVEVFQMMYRKPKTAKTAEPALAF